ncbi:MAG: acyltransferase [Bacteroidales bacterium]|nr:acyltransferase [Bacteroidales bacterium]
MNPPEEIRKIIFKISLPKDFNTLAIQIFHFQYRNNPVYHQFVDLLGKNPDDITDFHHIPFIPATFFRDQVVISGNAQEYERVFSSSGTTGVIPSKHYIKDTRLYENSFMQSFRFFYGNPEKWRIMALLPGYLERQYSSLVYMVDRLIATTRHNGSGMYLHETGKLANELLEPAGRNMKTMLFGASYALLDFALEYPLRIGDVTIMETGGMKGRKKEMVRQELHEILCRQFGVEVIHSEYGMTELLSQAYSQGNGIFRTPPWMKILIRDTNDPLQLIPACQTGGINIIDLANLYSCSFVATQDLGRINPDGSFEVMGRFDDSDVRGCNLLVV